MSALVDARGLHASGIGRYLREILGELLNDPRFSGVKLLGDPAALREFCAAAAPEARVTLVAYEHGFYSPRAQLAWLALRARGQTRAGVAFFPHYDAPLFALPERSVVTVHDLIHFKVPDAFAAWRRAAASVLLARGVAAAARVVTVSEATRRDLVERLPNAAAKVQVIPNGVSDVFRPRAGAGPVQVEAPPLAGPYLLCVGNRKPHKNLAAAVETLALLTAERPDLRLVFVGQGYEGWDAVVRRAEALGVGGRLVVLGSVDDERLRALYGACEALLFPSLYEGFGLPVLEAMAAGAPVVASDRASIPEVVGDAGLLVAPDDYRGMAAAVRRLAEEPGLRADLVRRGRARAAEFQWECTARTTVELLYRVAVGGRVAGSAPLAPERPPQSSGSPAPAHSS